jgi:hypothetical protein
LIIAYVSDSWGMEPVLLRSPPFMGQGELRLIFRATRGMRRSEPFRLTFVHAGVEMEAVCRLILCGRPEAGTAIAAVVAWAADAGTGLPH